MKRKFISLLTIAAMLTALIPIALTGRSKSVLLPNLEAFRDYVNGGNDVAYLLQNAQTKTYASNTAIFFLFHSKLYPSFAIVCFGKAS